MFVLLGIFLFSNEIHETALPLPLLLEQSQISVSFADLVGVAREGDGVKHAHPALVLVHRGMLLLSAN